MMKINATTKVRNVALGFPTSTWLFEKLKIDYLENDLLFAKAIAVEEV